MAKFENPKFVSKKVNDYVLQKGFHENDVAVRLRLETTKHARSVMMGDPTEAALFGSVLLPAIGAKKILEIGVFTGYTTLIMANAVGASGKVVALDVNDDFCSIGKPFWEEANVADRIDLRIGPALDSLEALIEDGQAGTFDFCFIDADKVNYQSYYEKALQLLRSNGIIAIDNVLWGGKVLDEENHQDEDTVALRKISDFVMDDDRVEHVLLPFADGVTLVRKK